MFKYHPPAGKDNSPLEAVMAETANEHGAPTPTSTAATLSNEKPAVLIIGGLGTASRLNGIVESHGESGC